MIECMMAWILLIIAFTKQEAEWFIASGVFAIATQIYNMRKEME